MAKKLQVFHSVISTSDVDASIASRLVRVAVQGEPWWNIHQRIGSAPRVSRMAHGSITFPTLLDIFFPSASTMWPRDITVRYGARPNTRVLTASNE